MITDINKFKFSSNIKIVFSITSTAIIYINTNLSKTTNNKTNSAIYDFFYHKEGTVCPFGVLCGKIMIILGLIQIYFLKTNKYTHLVRIINVILLILGFIASFMNIPLMFKLIPAFILQSLIIIF
tara:strand:- start:202 stop:576 length:375 start_codon:yes stop_codon:yes gene_type:complete